MKTLILTLFVIALAGTFNSCKKCVECKAEECASGINSDKKEYCGDKAERDQFQDSWMATYTAAGCNNVSCD